jgi:hypothetical protein|tara:strand:- start:357 stop:1316 length:960 start_codon:yes stop_codon:yes gene_type:complete
MIYLNIKTTDLRLPEMMGSDPVERATWLFVCAYCVEQENDGRIAACRKWKDRQWQQTCGVTIEEVDANTDLWAWDGDDLTVNFYPHDKQSEVVAKRIAGRKGGKRSGQSRKNATAPSPPPEPKGADTSSTASSTASTERKGREGKGKERNLSTAASGNAGEAVYLTRKKRKLTGKRLETFERFWIAFSHRKDKASAADSWLDIPQLTTPLVDEIVAAATAAAAGRAALTADGKTAQYAQGWITARRWEDEATTVQATMTIARPKETPEPENWRKAMEIKLEAAPVPLMKFKAGKAEAHWRQVDPTMQRDLIEIIKEHEL